MVKYLTYIEKTTKEIPEPFLSTSFGIVKKKLFYAKIRIHPACSDTIGDKSGLRFEVSDKRLETIYPIENCTLLDSKPRGIGNTQRDKHLTGCTENKIVCSLKWINTRNEFSLHILKSLLDYQSKYWFSGKEAELEPLTLKLFLSLYPLPYLDQTRLSRLIPNLLVMNTHCQLINLKDLFISKKKYCALLIKEIVDNTESAAADLKDKDIKYRLAQKGVYLSIRTICNCRKLFNIPSYKERNGYYYEKDITFSDYILLSKKNFTKFQMNLEYMN